ncbi:DUF1127 domain-containing protein [Azospirillum thermophilum]|uniref:YjiS-like domain-containing protein n=1 Tax=Azospirillum thermophilum TaxID=2202148 RepID=A0A2S2CM48_9PROT|nr:DUF1127 domain-containing protein [Azospirillum thermophilum]AWK85551.1 hypothetical protein DEW08_04660 [Azospirillum thermophilum]
MSYSSVHQVRGELFATSANRKTVFARIVDWVKARINLMRAEQELLGMSDTELADIGLTRGDVHNAVRYGRVG